jgi:coenzyme F420-reducing hydrogenase alpha subunit
MVGALARMNLNHASLHPRTRKDTQAALSVFPSTNIYHNNLAQAVEMLHAVDASIDLINEYQALPEKTLPVAPKESTGIGIIEAPRGTLFHKMEISAEGKIKKGTIIVPTGQNQIGIEHAIKAYVTLNVDQPKEILSHEIEKLIRAYDPCMSCATHFLKIKWK